MKRIGILGGTFDPIHLGHIAIAKDAAQQYSLDKVLLMTGGNPPHKTTLTSAEIRHEMVKLAAEGEDKLEPFGYEVLKKSYCYTAETLSDLTEKNPDCKYYFIIGEDSLFDILKWYKPEVIVKKCVLLVFPRGTESDLDDLIAEKAAVLHADIRPIKAPLFKVSSTEIRELVSEGKSIDGLVKKSVADYIEKNNLYKVGK